MSYPIKLAGTVFGFAAMNSDILGAEWQLRTLGLANVNQDGVTNVSDVLYLVNYFFAGGPAPSCPGT